MTAYMQNRLTNSQWYLLVGLVGLGLPLTVTIRVSRVSAMVSARFSVHLVPLWICQPILHICPNDYQVVGTRNGLTRTSVADDT